MTERKYHSSKVATLRNQMASTLLNELGHSSAEHGDREARQENLLSMWSHYRGAVESHYRSAQSPPPASVNRSRLLAQWYFTVCLAALAIR